MIAKSNCEHCQNPIEFEAEQVGQTVECPHCGKSFTLTLPKNFIKPNQKISNPSKNIKWGWLWLLLGIIVVIILAWIFSEPIGNAVAAIFPFVGGAIGGMILLITAIIGFILACLWTFFPWFVYSKMNRMNELLEKIERNTRK